MPGNFDDVGVEIVKERFGSEGCGMQTGWMVTCRRAVGTAVAAASGGLCATGRLQDTGRRRFEKSSSKMQRSAGVQGVASVQLNQNSNDGARLIDGCNQGRFRLVGIAGRGVPNGKQADGTW